MAFYTTTESQAYWPVKTITRIEYKPDGYIAVTQYTNTKYVVNVYDKEADNYENSEELLDNANGY